MVDSVGGRHIFSTKCKRGRKLVSKLCINDHQMIKQDEYPYVITIKGERTSKVREPYSIGYCLFV